MHAARARDRSSRLYCCGSAPGRCPFTVRLSRTWDLNLYSLLPKQYLLTTTTHISLRIRVHARTRTQARSRPLSLMICSPLIRSLCCSMFLSNTRLLSSSYGLRRASCCSHSLCSNPCCSHPTLPRAPRRPNSHTHHPSKNVQNPSHEIIGSTDRQTCWRPRSYGQSPVRAHRPPPSTWPPSRPSPSASCGY